MKIDILKRLRRESATISQQAQPSFYTALASELAFARETFFSHPIIMRCREDVLPFLNDEFGHGIDHSKKVAIEACALVMSESSSLGMERARRIGLLAQIAGLLHDSCRLEGEHAVRGADLSLMILQDYPLDDEEKQMISKAILCHEAFSPAQQFGDPRQQILADALYDADKFRWGPDNFSTTLWEICNYQEWSLEQILNKFPHGMEFISSIQHTFRTSAGKIYGPEFIDLGLEMGRQMYKKIEQFCKQHNCSNQTLA